MQAQDRFLRRDSARLVLVRLDIRLEKPGRELLQRGHLFRGQRLPVWLSLFEEHALALLRPSQSGGLTGDRRLSPLPQFAPIGEEDTNVHFPDVLLPVAFPQRDHDTMEPSFSAHIQSILPVTYFRSR